MFANALDRVDDYTMPVLFSRRHLNGSISSGCGTFIVVNRDGWILTAAHIVKEIRVAAEQKLVFAENERQRNEIANNPLLHPNDKQKRIRALRLNGSSISHDAVLWAFPTSRIDQFFVNEFADIAVARLQPFDPTWVQTYPVFKNPAQPMLSGTSLCRLGFPFHQINATFNEANGTFTLADGVLPIPRFPNDGIHTRIAMAVSPDKTQQAKFLETSTPGLKGQSGGPIFDRSGHVWAMQSRTQSLPLGFAPEVVEGNRRVVEHQFMSLCTSAGVLTSKR